jgi:hypothetical protein
LRSHHDVPASFLIFSSAWAKSLSAIEQESCEQLLLPTTSDAEDQACHDAELKDHIERIQGEFLGYGYRRVG